MTLKEFREYTSDMDGQTEILVPGQDHFYQRARAWKTTALFVGKYIYEDDGDELFSEIVKVKRKDVLVFA